MTREKKIKEEREITNLILFYIVKQQAFDYWLADLDIMTYRLYLITKVPEHRIRRYFFKNVYPNTEWLSHFEY